jgi:hypothetical protein
MSALDASATRVILRPRFFDRLCVCLLLFPGIQMLVMAVLFALGPKPATLHCDRGTQSCQTFFPTLFLGGNHYNYDLGDFQASHVVPNRDGTYSWKVDRGKGPLWLGIATKDPAKVAQYRRMAADLQTFLDHPQTATFDASFQTIGTAPWWLFVGVGLLACIYGFRWWRGWYAELELDRAAREITIHRRPMFFTGPRTVKLAASDVRLDEAIERRYVGNFQRALFARFELRDTHGKRVFRYATLYDKKSCAQLDGYLVALKSFFTPPAP